MAKGSAELCDEYPINCQNETGFCPVYPCDAIKHLLEVSEE